ncbi:hypothetical protein BC830DRAFT_1172467 [Chytriomyces sp. MP71]|nr:hypothetical protein BC830DRAFT_1172467 [Chytriomyces sp. MP71]
MAKRQPCPVCRVTKFRRDSTGLRFCVNGHQMRSTGHVEVGDDEIQAGARLRRIAKKRKARLVFAKGFRAATPLLLFEALQLSLKAQVLALINKRGFPPEIEHIVRDLWLAVVTRQGIVERASRSSATKNRQAQNQSTATQYTNKQPRILMTPNIQLLLIYLGCKHLRLPVMLCDVYRWAESGVIPFLNALDNLPSDFLQYVARHALAMKLFQKFSMPSLTHLQAELVTLTSVFKTMDIQFPPMNRPLILLRLVKDFKIPLELYVATEYVWEALYRYLQQQHRQNFSIWLKSKPEMVLMSCLIVAIRICYSLQPSERHVFISWLSNLPPIDDLLDKMKAATHARESLSKRTAADFDSTFQDSLHTFTQYCRNYLFDKTRLNTGLYGFHAVIDGILPSDEDDDAMDTQLPHSPTPAASTSRPAKRAKHALADLDPSRTYTTTPPAKGFKLSTPSDAQDSAGHVDAWFAELVECGSRMLVVDGKVLLQAIVAVEKGLEEVVGLFESQCARWEQDE